MTFPSIFSFSPSRRRRRAALSAFAAIILGASFAQSPPMPETAQALETPPVSEAAPLDQAPCVDPAAPTEAAAPAPADQAPSADQAPPSGPAASADPAPCPEILMSCGILVDGLQFDIPMPWGHEEFESVRAAYLSSSGRKWLNIVMERALPYMAYIEEKVAEYGLPHELVFLPVIESEFLATAVSRSGAAGLWQFMRNSIAGYGMSISDWKDERRDFMKSTDAAMRKLRDNFRELGDWPLAIAAYNAGLGAVARAIKSIGGEQVDFWKLYDSRKLSREPLSYIPKFLAVASILRYPELHGLPSFWGEKAEWEALETARQVDLGVLAARAEIPLEVLKIGNAELKYNITPPSAVHYVKVPAEKAEAVRTILSDDSTPLVEYEIYKVRSGDTLSEIAARAGTAMSIILDANPGLKADRIGIGQVIMIPKITGSGKAAGGSGAGTASDFSATYTIKKGDTLWDIALRYGVKPDALASANGIRPGSILSIGQKLKVPSR